MNSLAQYRLLLAKDGQRRVDHCLRKLGEAADGLPERLSIAEALLLEVIP